MLEIRNLYKAYGKLQVLDGLNLTIHEGELFGFVGSNGAGKTTTIKIITGLLQADSGDVLVDGVKAAQQREALKSKIGYVPDFFGVYDNLKVSEYMEFFASCYGIEGLRARQRYMTLLEQVGLEEKVNFYVDGLSRGMKQRLCLARALIQDPQLLVLDEPASGLDPRSRLEMKGILKELREQGKTIMLSSHILSELAEICTDIGIIDQGKMAAKGSIEDILSRVNASNPLLITVLGEVEKTMTLLRSHPYVQTISVKGKEISVGFSGEKRDEAMLLQRLVDAEIPVSGFMRERGSLESIFMQFIQQDKTSRGGGAA
ncbi:MAG: ABC transporter ATP-binding protein [bacterium]|nr:ABC transporter ATP-binding protein [bacterium]